MNKFKFLSKKLTGAMLVASVCIASLCGCGAGKLQDEAGKESDAIPDAQVFPATDAGFVGDPMPYYEDGTFHVFYLADLRDGTVGYHPWALYNTSDFCKYEDEGTVIPFGESMDAQDIALGTGCVIKGKDGMYHAFYTGHNDTYEPKEAIMHATSSDMKSWTKIKEDTFYANENYAKNDFRDPYVLYVESEKQYWMLVSTRNATTGVLAKYTSTNLKDWTDAGVFFVNDMGSDSNLECSSLIQYKDKWYLSFSDQWPNRQFHYRVSDDLNGEFKIPKQDVVDGNGFYAGRLETDGTNLYAFGWNGTKNSHLDSEDYNWGGNLVVHQLEQQSDGSLCPVLNSSVRDHMNHACTLEPIKMSASVSSEKSSYQFKGSKYEIVEFDQLLGSYLVNAKITDFAKGEQFGFAFDLNSEEVGNINLVFDVKENKIKFYNTPNLFQEDPQSELDMKLSDMDEINVSMLISDGVVSMYVNDKVAFTARMYLSQGTSWGLFAINSDIKCEKIELYK